MDDWDKKTDTEIPLLIRDDGEMKNYHHPACIFDTFKRVKATTKARVEFNNK